MDLSETNKEIIEKYIAAKRTYPFEDFPICRVVHNPHRQRHITSFGIIAYCKSTDKYLLVQRRYSPNYLTLMRGAYRRSNLPKLIMGMCNDELKMVRRIIFRQINIHELLRIVYPGGDHEYSAMRFDNHENYILQLINKAQSDKNIPDEAEWLFPRGRSEKFESNIDTALREFREETGVNPVNKNVVNKWPIVDYYKADNDFIYESRYWIIIYDDEPEIPKRFQSYEVATRAWKDRESIEILIKRSQINIFHESINQISKTD